MPKLVPVHQVMNSKPLKPNPVTPAMVALIQSGELLIELPKYREVLHCTHSH